MPEGILEWLRVIGKAIWWLVLVIMLTILLRLRWESIAGGTATTFDLVVFLVLAGLLLAPLFQEVGLFGLQLKAAIREVKEDVQEEITEFKADIRNRIEARASLSQQLWFPAYAPPTTDEQLRQMEERVGRMLENYLRSYGVAERAEEYDVATVPDRAGYLFGVRYNLERELRRIWQESQIWDRPQPDIEEKRPIPTARILNDLLRAEVLDPELLFVIRQVYSICSAAVHGEKTTSEQQRFVEQNAPRLLASLRAL